MTNKQFYKIVENLKPEMSFEEIHSKWLTCFKYMLKSFKVGYTDKICEHLFYNFDMENGKMFWKEHNPEYKDCTKEQLIDKFCRDLSYISDRYSYDRIFRVHWLFRWAFRDELNKVKYPSLFE